MLYTCVKITTTKKDKTLHLLMTKYSCSEDVWRVLDGVRLYEVPVRVDTQGHSDDLAENCFMSAIKCLSLVNYGCSRIFLQ